ncbi:unnamed protein product [Staurois parvus]|uniref:Replication termination factor 2 n=1 Tax=Staurois parvus TaxID=386267 RepID=A0ABN9DLI6_9NEOB|nr:unnamed protein product [Staurois parvus]
MDRGQRQHQRGQIRRAAHTQFICPIVGLEMNGKHRFCVLRQCGCVFSERALKEIKTDVCHKCGAGFQAEDIIPLNGEKDEVEELRKKMEDRRLKAKMEKKSKKSKAAESAVSNGETTEGAPGPSKTIDGNKTIPKDQASSVSTAESRTTGTGATSSGTATKRPNHDKSEAYKSIFTSHSSAKRTKEQSSNWITHTAYYF